MAIHVLAANTAKQRTRYNLTRVMCDIGNYNIFANDFTQQSVLAKLCCFHQMTQCHLAGRGRRCAHD
jgi:hypothetical protein